HGRRAQGIERCEPGPAAFFNLGAGGAEGAGFSGDDAARRAGRIGREWRANLGIGKRAGAEPGAAGGFDPRSWRARPSAVFTMIAEQVLAGVALRGALS